jgi:hypothetical protein
MVGPGGFVFPEAALVSDVADRGREAEAESDRIEARGAPAHVVDTWSTDTSAPTRLNTRVEEPNRYVPFSKKLANSGWSRSLHPLNWFDSELERRFANLIDDEDDVTLWRGSCAAGSPSP